MVLILILFFINLIIMYACLYLCYKDFDDEEFEYYCSSYNNIRGTEDENKNCLH